MAVKKQSFLKGVLVIMGAQVVIKLMGFIYRIILTNIPSFSDTGNSYYGSGYSVYAFILAIATMGIPNTISKLVSEKMAIGDKRGAHKIFKVAMGLFTIIGTIFALLLFFGSNFISTNILSNPGVKYTLMALAPAIIFVSMTSVIRGYFVGMQNMAEYSKAQIIEQIVNSVCSVGFVMMLLGNSPEIMAAGSTLATTVSSFTAFAYLLRYYNKNKKDIWKEIRESSKFAGETTSNVAKKLLKYAIPISLASVVTTLSSLIDTITVVDCLQKFGYTLETANKIYGILVGKVEVLNSVPLSLNVAFSVALVPFISAALAKGKKEDAVKKINFSLKVSGIIAFPAAVGLSMLANEIFGLVYPNASSGAYLLQIQAFIVIFSVITQTLSGSLQGVGKVYSTGVCLMLGVIVKYILNVIFIPIYGEIVAPISSVMYQLIACVCCFIILYRYLKVIPNLKEMFLKTIVSTIIMAVIIKLAIYVFQILRIGNTLATVGTIIIAVIIYALSIIKLKTLSKEEYLEFPMGEKIYKFASKIQK